MLIALLTLSLSLASAFPITSVLPRTTCYDGVYVIGARGSDEDPGYGSTASVVSGILSSIPSSGAIALDYPASVVDPLYDDSVSDGITTLIGLVEDYADNCGGEIVLVGFSQGANVITDALAGGVDKPDPLASGYVSYVSAVVVFGDPTFTHGQSFDAGTDTTTDGIFARSPGGASLALLNTYAAKIQSYCDNGDRYCASGDDADAHSEEIPTWGTAAVSFVVEES